MKPYIAGPMSGLPELNHPAFHEAAARWRAAGWDVLNPAEIEQPDPTPAACYHRDVALMIVFGVDAIAVLPGWQSSTGAVLEVTLAKAFGWPVYDALSDPWLPLPVPRHELIVTLDEYQANAVATMAMDLPLPLHRATLGLGIAGEAGEVADLIKKEIGHGHPADPPRILKEDGDVLWYAATVAEAYGYSLGEVARANAAKLAARYPHGFSTADSLERRDEGAAS